MNNPPDCLPSRTLAIAVAGDSAAVAVRRSAADIVQCAQQVGHAHSRHMLPLVTATLAQAGCALHELDGIVFEAGPGGFTTLRVACALAQGFGMALGVPVCPVGSLEAAAVSLLRACGETARGHVLVATDARVGECYLGVYEVTTDAGTGSAQARSLVEVAAVAPEQVCSTLRFWGARDGELRVVGDAWHTHGEVAHTMAELGLAGSAAGADAIALAMLAGAPAARWLDPTEAVPQYVRAKVALDVAEQRALRAARG